MAKKKAIEVNTKAEPPKGMLEKLGITDSQDLSNQINVDFSDSEQMKYSWIPERDTDVKSYFGVIKPSEWPFKGASQIKSQFQRIVVDVFSGNVIKSLFMPEHPIRPFPSPLGNKTTDDALDNIKYVDDLHNSLQANEYNLRTVLDKALPTALIESFVILSPTYEYLTEEIIVSIKRYVPQDTPVDNLTYDLDTDSVMTKDGQLVPSVDTNKAYMTPEEAKSAGMVEVQFDVTKEECIKDGISLKVVNGYRFFMPVSSPGETPYEKVQRGPYCIQQLFYTIREFEDYKDQGYFEDVDPALDDYFDPQRELITYTKYRQAGFVKDVSNAKTPYINCLKWSGKWKIDGKWRELVVWKDKNSDKILRVEPNIHGVRPYFPIVPFPIDDTPYGESLCKIIRPLVKELDLLMRVVTNIALMKAAPPKFYDPASGFNPATVGQFGPNSWIPAREPARNVLIPPQPEDPMISMQMIQLLINIIERITGINEVVQGQISDRANTTATEIQTAMVRSGVRFDQVYERIKEQLKPMFPYIHKLTLRHMSPTKEIRLMGEDNANRLVTIHKEQLEGKYEFELSGNSVVSEQQELQNSITLYNTLMQGPGLSYTSYKPESIYYILYNIVKRLNPIAKDKILPKPSEVAQLERDRQKVTQEQEQLAVQQQQQSGQAQAQAQAAQQQAQMQAALAQQEMQIKQAEVQQKLHQDEQTHDQKMRHAEETHKAKIEQMKETARAKAKEKKD